MFVLNRNWKNRLQNNFFQKLLYIIKALYSIEKILDLIERGNFSPRIPLYVFWTYRLELGLFFLRSAHQDENLTIGRGENRWTAGLTEQGSRRTNLFWQKHRNALTVMSEFQHSCALRPGTTTNWTSFRGEGDTRGGGYGRGGKVWVGRVTGVLYADRHRNPLDRTVYARALISRRMIKRYFRSI